MAKRFEDTHNIAWCPGCGNFAIRSALVGALEELGFRNEDVVMVSGIGQAAKMPQYIRSHYFNGLHGRAHPVDPRRSTAVLRGSVCLVSAQLPGSRRPASSSRRSRTRRCSRAGGSGT
jgi:pyruvate/2-oxoacid:ferredoxin oxidoreductase beta subunit